MNRRSWNCLLFFDRTSAVDIVTTHRNTDFDALASTIAAILIYPGALPVLPNIVNPNVKAFLSIHKDLFDVHRAIDVPLDQVKRLIVVDINKWSRLEGMKKLKHREDLEIHLWDHHPAEGNDIQASWICQEPMGATITLMVRELRDSHIPITPIQATLFLIGLYEDTGNLTFPACRAEDAYAAAFLLEKEADLAVVNRFLRPAYGERQKSILFEMLQRAERIRINGHAVCIGRVTLDGHVDSLALVVRMYREILNVDAAFGIFENPSKTTCMVIGRSTSEGIHIGAIMRRLGGGGHPGAGSAMLKSVNPAAVEDMIRELIAGNQQASVKISDLMSFPVFTVESDTPMHQVAELFREKGCTGFPVVEEERLVGVISRRDLRKLKKESQMNAPVRAFMARNVLTITPGRSPMDAARLMVKHDIGRLPVVDGDRLFGIVTRSDAMTYFYDLLPE